MARAERQYRPALSQVKGYRPMLNRMMDEGDAAKLSDMDFYAGVALKDLRAMGDAKKITAIQLAEWYRKHHYKAGYKRLGKLVVMYANANGS